MADLAAFSGTRSEDFFGAVERFQTEHMAREKLKRATGIGFERGGRKAALGEMFPVVIELADHAIVTKQAVAALIDFGDNFAALFVEVR